MIRARSIQLAIDSYALSASIEELVSFASETATDFTKKRHRADVRSLVSRLRAANPRVFGPVVRGGDADGSVLGILIDTLPNATLFDLGGIQVELEDMLCVPVRLFTLGDLPEKVHAKVLAEAIAF